MKYFYSDEGDKRLMRLLLAAVILLFIVTPFKVQGYEGKEPLSDQCKLNYVSCSLYNVYINISEVYNTTGEIDAGLDEEYSVNFSNVYFYKPGNVISGIHVEVIGNEFGEGATSSLWNYGADSNLTSDQLWNKWVKYNNLSCPTFDLVMDWVNVSTDPYKIRYDLWVNHYLSNETFMPTPTPTPTPNTTAIPASNDTYNYSYSEQEAWESYANETVSGWNDTIGTISGVSDVPLQNLRSGVQSLNSSLGNYSYSSSMPFLLVVIPAFIGALPAEFIGLITLSLVFVVILTVMRRK